MEFSDVQAYMRAQRIDGWLQYDFRGNNPVLAQLLPGQRWTTRRALLFIPAQGEAVLAVHSIDARQFASVAVASHVYLTWQDLIAWLAEITAGGSRIAMEYAPGGVLPAVSIADAGTVELVRALGAEVVSSANLIQVCAAQWSPAAQAAHARASQQVGAVKDGAFRFIAERLAAGQAVNEYEVQQHMREHFAAAGLEWPDGPIVAVNAHSSDPHYEPTAESAAPIRAGDWVLIDLWARVPGDENIFSDITWVGHVGTSVPKRGAEVFAVVRAARDAVVQCAKAAWSAKERVQGWQLDETARTVISDAGFGQYIRHRTGHSLSPGPKVHGLGMNLDNLETHDTREMLPGIGYTIEPGVYLPEFGVRLEINVFVDPQQGPTITSVVQDEVVLITRGR